MAIEEVLFDVSDALRVPVLVLVLLALAVVFVEFGALLAELARRRRRSSAALERAVAEAGAALVAGDGTAAQMALWKISWSASMRRTFDAIVPVLGTPNAEARVSKALADFDYGCVRKLERTRILVRFGPALGLMGTLIPLSPALAGLAGGDVETLTENLRVAFSVTVAGLLVGAFAFTISLVRDRLYGQDFSDAEYVANELLGLYTLPATPAPVHAAATPHAPGTDS